MMIIYVDPPPKLTVSQQALVVQVAKPAVERLWPGEIAKRCPDGPTLTWVNQKTVQKRYEKALADSGQKSTGVEMAAFTNGCSVTFSREEMSLTYACNMVVHELGHVSGQPHSQDKRSVMYEFGGKVPECQFKGNK